MNEQQQQQPQGFVKVQGAVPAGESFQATSLVSAAYMFIWLAVLVFVFSLWRRSRSTEREIDELRRKLETAGKKAA